MDRLLKSYCNLLKISTFDFTGDSHANDLPRYRHIFYYCVKTKYSNVRLRHIAKISGKKTSGVGYGIKKIASLVTPITKAGSSKNLITPEMRMVKDCVDSFLSICEEYKEKDLKLPLK